MDKFFNAIYKVKKEIAWALVVAMVAVVACCSLAGCTKEDVDKYRDITDTVIDLVDEVDELEKKIEDIIGEEAPCSPDVEVSGAMMADPPQQGGMAPPPSSPNNIRRMVNSSHILSLAANNLPIKPIVPPQGGTVNPLNMPTYVDGIGIKAASMSPPTCPVPAPTPAPTPTRPAPIMERPCLPNVCPVSTVIPPDFPNIITHPVTLPYDVTNVIWGDIGTAIGTGPAFVPDFEGMGILGAAGSSPGCLFENACWNGCA